MYKVGNGIKNGKFLVSNAGDVFENTTKDINLVLYVLADFRKNHPDYIKKIEDYYHTDITQILKIFDSGKTDLRKFEKDFSIMLDSLNKFNRNNALVLPKIKQDALPKLSPSNIEILQNGTLDHKHQFLVDYIIARNKVANNNISEVQKLWDSPSRKIFEGDINDIRKNTLGFVFKTLVSVPTKNEDQPQS